MKRACTHRARAGRGRFVSAAYAREHPKTTVRERFAATN